MLTYSLYLDESGDFKENGNKPSFVAGYLVPGNSFDEDKAKYLFSTVTTKADYACFREHVFHGCDELSGLNKAKAPSFIYDILQKMINEVTGIEFVQFKNLPKLVFDTSDRTYLNIFSDGICQLIDRLYSKHTGGLQLHIYYAQRQSDRLRKEEGDVTDPIDEREYEMLIKERLILRSIESGSKASERVQFALYSGVATKKYALSLADLVCTYYSKEAYIQSELTEVQRDTMTDLPQGIYTIGRRDDWGKIKNDLFDEGAARIWFFWQAHKEGLMEHRKEFKDMFTQKCQKISLPVMRNELRMLSDYVGALIHNGFFKQANDFIESTEKEFCPLLQKYPAVQRRFEFDLAFHRLTIATHQGDTNEAETCFQKCDALWKKIQWSLEDFDYCMSYQLRKIEHFKNLFVFDKKDVEAGRDNETGKGAKELLEEMRQQLDDARTLFSCIGNGMDVTSVTLGKVCGSLAQVYAYLITVNRENIEKGRQAAIEAKNQFWLDSDKSRADQNLCMIEYLAGNIRKSQSHLAEAVGLPAESPASAIADVLTKNGNLNLFGLAHYVTLMAKAFENKETDFANELFEALRKTGALTKIQEECDQNHYPGYVILWRLGITYYDLGHKNAEKYYEQAYKYALENVKNYPVYAAGLAIKADWLSRKESDKIKAGIEDLKKKYRSFNKTFSVAGSRWFQKWEEAFGDRPVIKGKKQIPLLSQESSIEKKKERLAELAGSIPIL